jgi:hypothetical protein
MSPSPSFLLASAAVLAGMAGAIALYLASPHQQWRADAWTTRWRHLPGSALSLLSLALLLTVQGRGTAVFSWLTVQMLVLTAMPFLGRWRRARLAQ